jgi:hypothetical protein
MPKKSDLRRGKTSEKGSRKATQAPSLANGQPPPSFHTSYTVETYYVQDTTCSELISSWQQHNVAMPCTDPAFKAMLSR